MLLVSALIGEAGPRSEASIKPFQGEPAFEIQQTFESGKKHRYQGAQSVRFNLSWVLGGKMTGNGKPPE